MPLLPGEVDDDAGFFAAETANDVVEVDDDEDDDDIAPKAAPQTKDDEDEEDEEDEEDGDEEVYEVEKIVKHGFLDDGTVQMRVKWKGYAMSEATWEPEKNMIVDAPEAVKAYYDSIGGKPGKGQTDTRKKRKADESGQSAGTRGRKKNKSEDPEEQTAGSKRTKEWQLPKGSWENDINSIDAVEESELPNGEKKIMAFVIWNNGVRSKHPLLQLHDKSPKKMLQYYYDHLSFTRAPDATEDAR